LRLTAVWTERSQIYSDLFSLTHTSLPRCVTSHLRVHRAPRGPIGCDQGLRGPSGQACLWWSQGCSIGCKQCATVVPGFPKSGFVGKPPQAGKLGFNTR
jgi:hypothetical protein